MISNLKNSIGLIIYVYRVSSDVDINILNVVS